MANINAPFGFRQYKGNGSPPTFEQTTAKVASNNSTAIFFGDPVVPLSTGYIARASVNTVQLAGVFVGCKYLSVALKRTVWSNYWPGADANGDVEAYVINDPNARFVAQSGATGVAFADINANIGIDAGTGNTATGISGAFLDVSTINTTNTLPFRVVELVKDPPGSPGTFSGAYNWVVVAFNNVSTKQLTGI
jgi:hypothetical protein